MIVQLKRSANQKDYTEIVDYLKNRSLNVKDVRSEHVIVFGVIGDISGIDPRDLYAFEAVEKVTRVSTPFKRASRAFHPDDTIIDVTPTVAIGNTMFTIIAGPCSIESEVQLKASAKAVKEAGGHILRGGAFKPRTSPYSFQGLGVEGLQLLRKTADQYNLAAVSEIPSADMVDVFEQYVDIIQVGARNMQNFHLLKALSTASKPIMLKRGLSATIEEWLMAAEYIMAGGNQQVILCERGIRTFEKYTRNTLDISAVLAVQELSHLPVITDPSHAAGRWNMIEKLSHASLAVGASGLMIEIHPDPANALSDGAQSLKFDTFSSLMDTLQTLSPSFGKRMS